MNLFNRINQTKTKKVAQVIWSFWTLLLPLWIKIKNSSVQTQNSFLSLSRSWELNLTHLDREKKANPSKQWADCSELHLDREDWAWLIQLISLKGPEPIKFHIFLSFSSKVDVSLRCNLGNILIKPLSRDDWLRKEKNKIGHNIDLAVIALTSSGFHLSREIKFETLIPSNKSRKDLWPIKYESANFFQRGKVSKVESHDQKYRRPVLQTRDDFSHLFPGASLGRNACFIEEGLLLVRLLSALRGRCSCSLSWAA